LAEKKKNGLPKSHFCFDHVNRLNMAFGRCKLALRQYSKNLKSQLLIKNKCRYAFDKESNSVFTRINPITSHIKWKQIEE